jgi:hypothetical protein
LILLVVGAIVAAGCGGDDDETSSPPSTTTKTTEPTVTANPPSDEDSSSAPPSPSPSPDAKATRKLRRYFKQNFGGGYGQAKTSWYDNIKNINVENDVATIRTDIYDDADAKMPANAICLAATVSDQGVADAVVTGRPDGSTLKQC